MSYILMFYYNPLNPPFLRGTWSMIILLNRYKKTLLTIILETPENATARRIPQKYSLS